MPTPLRTLARLTPLLLAATACTPALHEPRSDAKPLTAVPFEQALGADWHLTYRDMPGTDRRMGTGAGQKSLRIGVVETKSTTDTLTSLACQAFGKDVGEATRFLLSCAKAATNAPKPVLTWLTTHIDRPSTGPGHTTTHNALDYHLGVNRTQAVRVLYISRAAGKR
ncbi:hypothetical protein PV682_40180 [Streptomyces niveiscabiei]|uniref:hypothetical protein n=1 Tax=Streptomyces niveiscabiei TaxID=164115 RepID=UPI0029AA622C|nr:hypothetical protein [Streptomyces niveiscabiei]MDX3387619.1 hypothetical protein [Streptomyces niveiscabiei]